MPTNRAVVLPERGEPLTVSRKHMPIATAGSAVIKVLATPISANMRDFFSGITQPFYLATPLTPGSSAVGRVHSLGPDSTSLKVGQLVYADFYTRSRDDPQTSILQGYIGSFGNDKSGKLMDVEWRDGSFAEYARFPLENIHALDEELLFKKMEYKPANLTRLMSLLVASGGMMQAGIKPGDSVIVAPATGYFGGDGIRMALAIGAKVVAAAWSKEALEKMEGVFGGIGRFAIVVLSGDVATDSNALKNAAGNQGRGADVFVDYTPPEAVHSTHIAACFEALAPSAQVLFLGGIMGNVEIPYGKVMRESIKIQGKFMHEREHVKQVIKLVETGVLKLGPGVRSGSVLVGTYKLEDAQKALDEATTQNWERFVVIEP